MMYIFSILLPLAAGFLVLLPSSRNQAIRVLLPLAALPALLTAISGTTVEIEIPALILGLRLGPGMYGRTFLAAAALVWLASSLFTFGYMAGKQRITSFVFFFCLTMSGNFGLILARDIPSFYTFFALMTYAAYGLVVHDRRPESLQAGKLYLIMALCGEAAIITAIFLTVSSAPGIGLEDILPALQISPWKNFILTAAFIGFGVKAGAFLMHFWLPLAHPAAPSPASAVLSGSMIKAGLLGWLYFFPAGAVDFHSWGIIFVCFGISALFYGVIVGLLQFNPKSILAYSSISQMGLMTFTLGVGLYDAELRTSAMSVLLLLVINHSLSKGLLFLLTGAAVSAGKNRVAALLLPAAAFFAVLALAGFPWTAGAAVKYGLKEAAALSSLAWPVEPSLLLTLSSVATAFLLGHFLIRLQEKMAAEEQWSYFFMWIPLAILLSVLALAKFIAPHFIGMETDIEKMTHYDPWPMAWPVLAGFLLAFPFRVFCAGCALPDFHYGRWAEQIQRPFLRLSLRSMIRLNHRKKRLDRIFWSHYASLFGKEKDTHPFFKWIEHHSMQWHTAGLIFVTLLVVFILLTLLQRHS
jgi:formate hydrogenlyase subunit 3/multisubunit Na+/H+ antiporter MnhD subunit